ncbi:MAG: hypothetical protein HYY16_14875 [Planctomycetes bacterium]|nr:hypothetical protein [Planctomycetota bacterium]
MERARERGAYYTPPPVAEALCRWAVRPGDRVLDPACGDGVFLRAARDASAEGIEIDPAAARAAGARCADFFQLTLGMYDAVVGNPPYVHFDRLPEASRRLAVRRAAELGVRFGAAASTWAPFLVLAASLVRPGGRLAMVIPRETLYVNYALPLLAYLRHRFSRVDVTVVTSFLFPGALEKVAILTCDDGPAGFRIREVRTADDLTPSLLAGSGEVVDSWAWTRVPRSCRDAVRAVFDRLVPMSEVAQLNVGIVTGDKDFFMLPRGTSLPARPAVATPMWIRGATVRADDLGERCMLLDVPSDYAGGRPDIDAYLEEGRRHGVHRRYKCAERARWWRPRISEPPHAFLGYLSDRLPRMALNPARLLCTNNVHRVTFRERAAAHVAAFYNPATLLSVELFGRELGDSALKIEPGDATKIRVVRTPGRRPPLATIDRALRAGREEDAIALAAAYAGIPHARTLMRARAALRDLRLRERRMISS